MTTDRPVFSLITVTRNNLEGLKRTADSVQSQSFTDYEWIIVDGDSTDGTKSYIDTLPVRRSSEPDKGIYDAMNKGIERALGDYLLFLNAGDTLADMDILSSLATAISVHAPDFIYGDALETGGFYKKARHHDKINTGMFTHHQAMLYRRDKIGSLRYDLGYTIAADYGFTAKFLSQNKNTAHYIPCAVCVFENGGISEQSRFRARREQFLLRRDGGMPVLNNVRIFCVQTITASIRQVCPQGYRIIRKALSDKI